MLFTQTVWYNYIYLFLVVSFSYGPSLPLLRACPGLECNRFQVSWNKRDWLLIIMNRDYCEWVSEWTLHGTPSIHKMQRVQNNAASVVHQAPRRPHVHSLLKELHWLPASSWPCWRSRYSKRQQQRISVGTSRHHAAVLGRCDHRLCRFSTCPSDGPTSANDPSAALELSASFCRHLYLNLG